ncbi:MAG: DUF2380 domain-containing protein [Myxococcota bacterium]
MRSPAARRCPIWSLPALATAAWLVLGLGPAHADKADKTVALIPLESLSAKSNARTAKLDSEITRALGAVPGYQVVAAARVRRAFDKQPQLGACDGKAECLVELGRATGADYIVFGEVGGLGQVTIVYLKAIAVADASELRSTTADFSSGQLRAEARAAAFRLLAPDRYRGTLAVAVDIANAAIYVDGKQVARSPTRAITIGVGTRALRVTHPEFRDFVRFVDIRFAERTEIAVELSQFALVSSSLERDGAGGADDPRVIYRGVEPTPWYRRWYSVAGFGAAVLLTSAVTIGLLSGGIDSDQIITVGNPL